ncbi:histone-lysine N-methyltransferase SETMAR [Plakobranchus ocellatus]|uniref:Histone-lysine N-methyltransferase SETMAR n=1 Tax=Plakobranchus ocellatus TaxID=259542 RepID=A0AAV3YDT7_9GAST|nr:histone-lysine N-methyltransferase SETMAR [Plakobranchus ocellatus]
MATPIKEWSKLEVRAVVRFLFSKGTKPSEIHKQIAETYGEGAMSRSRVYQWCTWFGEGRTSLGDEPKSGRPKTSTNEENTTRVDELIRCDRRMKIREIALKLEIPKSTVHEIVHDTLGYRKVSARWVPKMLTEDHKLQRVEISLRLLQRCQQDNGDEDTTQFGVGPGGDFQANNSLFDNLITGDETWCINAARYCSTLDRLKEAIRRKRPGLLRRGVVLQHYNATPHSANLTQQWLQRYGWEILPHPAHSSDLALSDFHLFGPLKRHLGGMAFETEDDLISELRNWFDNLDVDFFRVGINSLLSR